jgi:hypothetical protein
VPEAKPETIWFVVLAEPQQEIPAVWQLRLSVLALNIQFLSVAL